jgi:ABC-2 type transport system permease protein
MHLKAPWEPWGFLVYSRGIHLKKYLLISRLAAINAFDGGIMYILGGYLLHLAQLIVLLLVWRSLATQGADTGDLTLQQLLLYTLAASILGPQLNVITPATTAFWEGSLISRYLRPVPVLLQLVWETFGNWLPGLVFYSLPILLLSPLLGLNLLNKAGNLPYLWLVLPFPFPWVLPWTFCLPQR